MTFDWKTYEYCYNNRIRNLDVKAQGVLKSNKFFPVFQEGEKEIIFKPLSRTKPLSTPYFAYSEVFWSTIIKRYFDSQTPVYRLARCEGIESEFPNKYSIGTVVESLERDNYKLVNLYEYFQNFPDSEFDSLKDYINFCEKFYDYRSVLSTRVMKENPKLASKFAKQILLSILKIDQNYHYENPLLKTQDSKLIDIAPMIDHEFSTMFLYLDNESLNQVRFKRGLNSLGYYEEEIDILSRLLLSYVETLSMNLEFIVENYPNTAAKFLEELKIFLRDFEQERLVLEDHGFINPFSSDDYLYGEALYKKNDLKKANEVATRLNKVKPDIEKVSTQIQNQVQIIGHHLEEKIENHLAKKYVKK